ncbi:UDP-4-amino-4,6-dideoxy-N-acetyl-beta-L-altrosamine transaminase [Legionella jordanis]|uniref:AHBA synthase n=1 Tax=Legionella jordanis TaxID=456 RepID=A0A0W0VFT6_9GAMM|nr:UDP-4-amino-4,6-dideoxy-N-acetyl-beta-L-altrosamine transaminase [Legionella jordanis]KTD18976.1 AHBA synthase [Legionella jordanis]VEH13077.1 AHBA synthase [Legionella jordanis]
MSEKLALHGGTPVRSTLLPYARQSIDEDDRKAVEDVLKGDWLTTGPMVKQFEEAVSHYAGAKEAVAVNTGTAALHAAAWAANIGSGDEVIVPAISFVASANCVLYLGGKPVFADLSPDTLNIDPKEIERKITSKTKAIIAVDFAGHPCDHDAIRDIAKKNNLTVIEDAAHSLGASYKSQKVGSIQEMTILSFHPVKHVTTGEGGMVLTNDAAKAKRMRSFRHHGIDLDFHQRAQTQSWRYDIIGLGYNYRIPDINCALGLSQLSKLDAWLERRRFIADCYQEGLSDLSAIELPTERENCSSAWHLYVMRLNFNQLKANRDEIFAALRAENIGVNVHYIPIPWMSYYQQLGYQKGNWPVAETEYERMISLPMFPAMNDKDIEDAIAAIRKVITAYRK